MTHPQSGPQPICADRLTVSRQRIQRLIDKPAKLPSGVDVTPTLQYIQGARDALAYLLDPDNATPRLTATLEV